jgi:hypothetical protein
MTWRIAKTARCQRCNKRHRISIMFDEHGRIIRGVARCPKLGEVLLAAMLVNKSKHGLRWVL